MLTSMSSLSNVAPSVPPNHIRLSVITDTLVTVSWDLDPGASVSMCEYSMNYVYCYWAYSPFPCT